MHDDKCGLRAWSHMLGAHALAVRTVDERLKAAGQHPLEWYDVLLELERSGGQLRIGDLAQRIVIEPYNMTRLLDRLEDQKLIRREKSEGDRRGALAVLTEEGLALRRGMWPHYRRAIFDVFGRALSAHEADGMVRACKKVIAHLRGSMSTSRAS